LDLLRSALTFVTSLAQVRCVLLERLLGIGTWVFCLRRGVAPGPAKVFTFVRLGKTDNGHTLHITFPLWASVRQELVSCRNLLPLARVQLCRPLAPFVVCTDAEGPNRRDHGGGAVVWSQPSPSALRLIAAEGPLQSPLSCSAAYLGTLWGQQWEFGLAVRWRFREAIHLTELESILLWLKRAVADSGLHGCCILTLCDNTAVVGAIRKGRSPSGAFLARLRKFSALCLAADLAVTPLWLPSWLCFADGPSRALFQQPLGPAGPPPDF